jgi:hypothetical protein
MSLFIMLIFFDIYVLCIGEAIIFCFPFLFSKILQKKGGQNIDNFPSFFRKFSKTTPAHVRSAVQRSLELF